MKYNYHTHTSRCFHAKGSDEDFVKAAIEAGFDEIGFADHSPWPFEGYVSGMRMHVDEFPVYCQSIKNLREKYKDRISIKLGLECEYFPEYMPWLKKAIDEKEIDYIILGRHFSKNETGGTYNGNLKTPEQLYIYRDDIIEAIETGVFAYVAHPDIFMRGYPVFDGHCRKISCDIIEKAIETNTPLEYNLLGLSISMSSGKPDYPYPDFWDMVGEMKAPVTMGIDAHIPEAYLDRELFAKGLAELDSRGLKIVDRINMFR